MVVDHVAPSSLLSDRIADQLREAIIHGELKPGDRLKEAEVASQLGVSTIPVREAFGQLEREGLITNLPRRGKFVRALTEQDLHGLYRLRASLEAVAYEMIYERGGLDAKALDALARSVEEERQALEDGDVARAARLDLTFHDRIYHEAGSDLLVELWQVLRARLNVVFYWRGRTRASPTEFNASAEHEYILEALRRNDLETLSELARGVGRRDVGTTIERLREERIVAEKNRGSRRMDG
jgi:DNA-binding GntR family transcriptional regulator